MLFPYVYVPHQIEKMQEFIDHIFFEVWCRAPEGRPWSLELFQGNPDLQEVMTDFSYSDTKAADQFAGAVQRIYGLFATLTPNEIDQFSHWYRGNNDVERICANDASAQLLRYSDLPTAYSTIRDQLASFFKALYPDILEAAAIRAKIGEVDEHYKAFAGQNDVGVCPFCGLNLMLGAYACKREAYDHYLPKALYPFNSINFRNLAPACHHCNSSYKTRKDPAYQAKDPAGSTHRRRVFYPYRTTPQPIQVSMTLAHGDFAALKPEQIEIAFGPEEVREEINTWLDVYGVEERYKDFLLNGSGARYWWQQALDEWQGRGETIDAYLEVISNRAGKCPYIEKNFLHKAFLDACAQRGLLNSSTSIATASSADQ